MPDPAEIIANTIFRADAWKGDDKHKHYLAQARKAVEALEAAGYAITAKTSSAFLHPSTDAEGVPFW